MWASGFSPVQASERTWVTVVTTAETYFVYTDIDAIVTVCSSRGGPSLDQIHLRLSCPPFISAPNLKSIVSGTNVLHVCLSV